MKSPFPFLSLLILLLLSSCGSRIDYEAVKSYQDPSVPALELAADMDTRVLLVFPHADDEMICAGLLTQLKAQGANIHLLTLGSDIDDPERREAEQACAAEAFGIDHFDLLGLPNNPWDQVLSDSIVYWYDHQEEIKRHIQRKIDAYRPHILITYDTEIGGYGHPEHRISAELVEEIFLEQVQDSNSSAHSLYQMTLTEGLEGFLVKGKQSYELALERTGSKGLPEPEVALDIRPYWETKNRAGHCYASQAKTLKKFNLIVDEEDLEAHREAFSHEYYTVRRR